MKLRRITALVAAAAIAVAATWSAIAEARAPQTPPQGSTLVVLGDSITWGTNYFSKSQSRLAASNHFEKVIVDSRWGRRISGLSSTRYSGNAALKQLTADGVRPTAVIVALGTNDVAIFSKRREYAALIRELMTTIGNIPVVWVNVHRADTPSNVNHSRLFNTTLERTLAEYPLASAYDWVAVTQKDPKVLDPDKIHLTSLGNEVRTQVYLDLAAVLAQRVVDQTTTTTIAVATTSAATTVPVSTVPTTTVATTTTTKP